MGVLAAMEDVLVTTEDLQLVVFRLANEEYGLPITKVQEINRLTPITKLPQTPVFMEGVINLRGRIIPVIDLRKRFELAVEEYTDDTRIIVVDFSGQTVGVIVDAVTEVVRLAAASVEPPPNNSVLDARYIEGVGKMDNRLLILLAADQIFTSQEEFAIQQTNG
ncbi:CheW protein [Dendrosporobacter quercicolus]|uniref:Chemotaxis protein CheW n=2 Tax=Dendrosporobacter quercicolus TaxID=146817 RepID=A0A1G9QPP7_9FIRM|nr:CheW protein [Dendrosporobacter quercicolus]